jgi:hypothetical protein
MVDWGRWRCWNQCELGSLPIESFTLASLGDFYKFRHSRPSASLRTGYGGNDGNCEFIEVPLIWFFQTLQGTQT